MLILIITSIEFWSSWKYKHGGGGGCINANAVDVDDVDDVNGSILNDAFYIFILTFINNIINLPILC